jgi:hypothetical protein
VTVRLMSDRELRRFEVLQEVGWQRRHPQRRGSSSPLLCEMRGDQSIFAPIRRDETG